MAGESQGQGQAYFLVQFCPCLQEDFDLGKGVSMHSVACLAHSTGSLRRLQSVCDPGQPKCHHPTSGRGLVKHRQKANGRPHLGPPLSTSKLDMMMMVMMAALLGP